MYMVTIVTTIFNSEAFSQFKDLFSKFPNDYFFENGTYYKNTPPVCPNCNQQMVHNGYNMYTKANMIKLNIGKYRCMKCGLNSQESPEIFYLFISKMKEAIKPIVIKLRAGKMSYRDMESLMDSVIPMNKDLLYKMVHEIIDETEIADDEEKEVQIIGFDEQYVGVNGERNYRMTIINHQSHQPVIDKVMPTKNSEDIKDLFLSSKLDFNKPTIITTDLDKKYPAVLDDLFGKNLLHQPCLFHLFKLIKKDFPRNCSIKELLLQEQLFNVFYDHSVEIHWLSQFVTEEQTMLKIDDKKAYKLWLKQKNVNNV